MMYSSAEHNNQTRGERQRKKLVLDVFNDRPAPCHYFVIFCGASARNGIWNHLMNHRKLANAAPSIHRQESVARQNNGKRFMLRTERRESGLGADDSCEMIKIDAERGSDTLDAGNRESSLRNSRRSTMGPGIGNSRRRSAP